MRYIFLLLLLVACAPSSAKNAEKATTYGVELQLCVQTAKTLAESQKCRCEVNTRWSRPCTEMTDGGGE